MKNLNNINLDQLKQLVQDVHEGVESPLKAFAVLKEYLSEVKICLEAVEESAQIEASRYKENAFESDGLKFEKRNGRKSFDFKSIPEWVAAKEGLKEIETRYKSHYNHYLNGGLPVTGDGVEIVLPVVKTSKDILIYKSKSE